VKAASETAAPRRCPLCAEAKRGESTAGFDLVLRKGDLRLARCRDCGLVFANPVPASFGDSTYYNSKGAGFYVSDDKLKGDYSPVRYRREIALLRRFCPRGAVLDVGCSTGGFLFHLKGEFSHDYAVCGTDVAMPALDFAEGQGIPVERKSFLAADFPKTRLEAITFWAVLEHVLEPGEFLRQARRLLKPDGVCLVLVPNMESLAVRLLGAKYRYILPQHLNYFSPRTLARLAEACGYEVFFRTTTHFNPAVIWQDFRSRDGVASDAARAQLLVRTNALKERRTLSPLHAAYRAVEKLLGAAGLADNAVAVLRPKAGLPASPSEPEP